MQEGVIINSSLATLSFPVQESKENTDRVSFPCVIPAWVVAVTKYLSSILHQNISYCTTGIHRNLQNVTAAITQSKQQKSSHSHDSSSNFTQQVDLKHHHPTIYPGRYTSPNLAPKTSNHRTKTDPKNPPSLSHPIPTVAAEA